MTYALSLQQFVRPEFYRVPPKEWDARLREISPITETLSHLRFRWREPKEFWNHPEQGQWELYACTPRHLVTRDRALQFAEHWSEMPLGFQEGRKSSVSSYQHYMWHLHGVDVRRFWVLQGWGGTPAQYSRREVRYLDGCGAISEPFPLGFFPACPFDERSTQGILARDRLVQSCQNFDKLEQMDRPDVLKAEDDAAEQVFREKYLDTWYEMIQPQAEFMKSYLRKSEADMTLPPAPEGTADALAQWKEQYVETGTMIGAKTASSRALQVAVV